MLRTLRRADLVGTQVVDRDGTTLGKVRDTYPLDGGGEPEMVLIDVGRPLPRRRWLPVRRTWLAEDRLRVPFALAQVVDAPPADDVRWGDPADVARAYWIMADD